MGLLLLLLRLLFVLVVGRSTKLAVGATGRQLFHGEME
jgi:hypothetical protein